MIRSIEREKPVTVQPLAGGTLIQLVGSDSSDTEYIVTETTRKGECAVINTETWKLEWWAKNTEVVVTGYLEAYNGG